MEETYQVFKSRVTAARNQKIANLDEVAQGRLFTGVQAKAAGLVDDVGTLNDAVIAAAKAAQLEDDYRVIVLPEPKTVQDIISDMFSSDTKMPAINGTSLDALHAVISSLPPEVRETTLRAMRMLELMQRDEVLLAMPAGLVEMPAHHQR
jgi:protease-4